MAGGLTISAVTAGYGETVVLEGLSLSLASGGVLAVLGRNGVGKTTLLATVMGHTTLHSGELRFDQYGLARLPAHRRARLGIGYVPQEREIFPSLSVEENLAVGYRRGSRWSLDRVFGLFPLLGSRRRNGGNQLSGGEQQMLAIGRALMGDPKLLLMDEPLEGLAPVVCDTLFAAMLRLKRDAGLTILLVEQHVRRALDFADHAIVLERGKIVLEGPTEDLRRDPGRLQTYLGVSQH